MNKKGFTLVELLAVLVLLALIAIIIVPNALRTTSKTEKKAFVESVKGVLRGVNEYYSSIGDYPEELDISDIPSDADIDNVEYLTGTIELDDYNYKAVNISDGSYCANGFRNSLVITDGNCN